MNKVKKIFISLSLFFTNIITKVYAIDLDSISRTPILYGVFEPPEPTIGEKISGIGKIALPLILFIIGLFVVLSKKITKKVKVITISILLTIGILSWIVLNYIANSY